MPKASEVMVMQGRTRVRLAKPRVSRPVAEAGEPMGRSAGAVRTAERSADQSAGRAVGRVATGLGDRLGERLSGRLGELLAARSRVPTMATFLSSEQVAGTAPDANSRDSGPLGSVGGNGFDVAVAMREVNSLAPVEGFGQLVGSVAHDLSNWLQVISGSCDALESAVMTGENPQRRVDAIRGAARAAALLTQHLRPTQALLPIQMELLNLNATIGTLEPMLTALLGTNPKIKTKLGLEAELWPTMGDAAMLQRVLLNLLVNARDAMPDGGTVTISTRNRPVSGIYSVSRPGGRSSGRSSGDVFGMFHGDAVQLTVRDTGTGMSEATRLRAFDPYFSTKPAGRGRGMGLAISRSMVHQLGGQMEAESRLGEGTSIHIFLPRAQTLRGSDLQRMS